MKLNVAKEVAALNKMATGELKARYAELFGEETRTGNRAWLVKRIAWRIQVVAEGDISERARRRAEELANDADLRVLPPADDQTESKPKTLPFSPDKRLPTPGTVITRQYKKQTLRVTVGKDDFEYEGESYPSLSAVAKKITGSHCNGFLFFGLTKGAKR
jgi:hypothetical protein